MKKMLATTTLVGFTSLTLFADDKVTPYLIQRENEVIKIFNMPTFTISEPITNSFIYNNGEYIEAPYVVSVSNLTLFINGVIIQNYEHNVHLREYYSGSRIGLTPGKAGATVDQAAEGWVRSLKSGTVFHLINGSKKTTFALRDGDGGALELIERARKAVQGGEQAKQQFTREMGFENHLSVLRPGWIERLANNTNLETRATAILEAKREREKQERERREQNNR